MKISKEELSKVEPRLLTEDEWEKFRDFRLRASKDAPEAFGELLSVTKERTESEWRIWSGKSKNFVIESHGKIISSVTLRKDGDGWMINGVWTDPEYRSQGLSKKLLQAAIEEALELSVTNLTLTVNSDLTPAVSLYKSVGFKPVGKPISRVMSDGSEHPEQKMKLDLANLRN